MAQEEACKVSPTMVGRIILRCLPLASLQTSNTRTSQVGEMDQIYSAWKLTERDIDDKLQF